jgi:hypothetical protein
MSTVPSFYYIQKNPEPSERNSDARIRVLRGRRVAAGGAGVYAVPYSVQDAVQYLYGCAILYP